MDKSNQIAGVAARLICLSSSKYCRLAQIYADYFRREEYLLHSSDGFPNPQTGGTSGFRSETLTLQAGLRSGAMSGRQGHRGARDKDLLPGPKRECATHLADRDCVGDQPQTRGQPEGRSSGSSPLNGEPCCGRLSAQSRSGFTVRSFPPFLYFLPTANPVKRWPCIKPLCHHLGFGRCWRRPVRPEFWSPAT